MLYLGLLTLLALLLFIFGGKFLQKASLQRNADFINLSRLYEAEAKRNLELKESNLKLKLSAEEIIALYDLTKDICKSLDENKIFSLLKERVKDYINITELWLLKDDAGVKEHKDSIVFPLSIDKTQIGYLAAEGLAEEDKEKFAILCGQFLLGAKRAILYRRIQEMAITDSLTQASNRRYFLERFEEELSRSKEFNFNLSFIMADIDRFKEYNDRYGHLVGDAILREVAKTIRENIRQIDFMGRYAGDELTIVLTETDKEQARLAAERMRQAIEAKEIRVYDEKLKVTLSMGIAGFPGDQTIPAIIDKADAAMYRAKEAGRNKVCL